MFGKAIQFFKAIYLCFWYSQAQLNWFKTFFIVEADECTYLLLVLNLGFLKVILGFGIRKPIIENKEIPA